VITEDFLHAFAGAVLLRAYLSHRRSSVGLALFRASFQNSIHFKSLMESQPFHDSITARPDSPNLSARSHPLVTALQEHGAFAAATGLF